MLLNKGIRASLTSDSPSMYQKVNLGKVTIMVLLGVYF